MNRHDMKSDPLVVRAIEFASQAHGSIGQTRKYSGEPYIVHPLEVMDLLLQYCESEVTPQMCAAAANHDVVEDTPITLDEVREALGDEVATLVDWLTDVSTKADGNRKARKALDLAHTASAPVEAKNVKLADLISNLKSIVDNDPGFARVWMREKEAILNVCAEADAGLLGLAWNKLQDAKVKLG